MSNIEVKQEAIEAQNSKNALEIKLVQYQIVANRLTDFINKNNLSVSIKGKKYVTIDGWQFCATNLGYLPTIERTEDLSKDKEYNYLSVAYLVDIQTGMKHSQAFAYCSNTEAKKETFEKFAVLSMSQTRAISKACRNAFGHLFKQAGFETTPFEDIDGYDRGSKAESDVITKQQLNTMMEELNKIGITKEQMTSFKLHIGKEPNKWNKEDLLNCYEYFGIIKTLEQI